MHKLPHASSVVALVAALASPVLADGLNPGSVLVYPAHFSEFGEDVSADEFSIISITNTNLNPVTGSTNVHFQYVNQIEIGEVPVDCAIGDRIEVLTPGDSLSVLSHCHNPAYDSIGYLVVSAQDPNVFNEDWAFDHLIGSELVIGEFGIMFSLNAIPFRSPQADRAPTDVDGDEQIDFDGVEYEGVPDQLYIDSFVAVINSSLILINLTGGPHHEAVVAFDIFNDNEFPLSATTRFNCWMQRCLAETDDTDEECISLVFSETFLANNTPDDPRELDLGCDGTGDLETGWARIRGLTSSSSAESLADPALLGATVNGQIGIGGRRLWESEAKQLNGDFLNLGTVVVDQGPADGGSVED